VLVELEGAAVVRTLPDLPVSPFPGGLVLRVDSSTTPSTLFAVATGQDRAVYRTVPPLDVFAFPVLTPAPAASPARAPAALETALAASALSGPVHAAPAAGLLGSLAATECPLGAATSLCLDGSRFEVEVRFSAAGLSGNGQTAPLTGDIGFFWLLSPANLELAVKVLDGRAVNGHFWIFSGALTDFHYVLKITDTATGAIRTYDNPAGRLTSFVDTSAF
jgi:hypothetical protein